ncbi:unnamed protein product [Coregonus sp. 'balchen']|nr:unnamed protein product [Coregonus sp. 'balchen']
MELMTVWSLVLMVMSIHTVQGQLITSSEPVVNRPGESVTLSCTVSGFSMDSYWMHWIHQKPWKGLDTGTIFAQSLQGQFIITKYSSKNQLYLEAKSLKHRTKTE